MASSLAQCSSNLQHHHVPLRFPDFRNSSCKETPPALAQFCLLTGGSWRKPQLPEQVRETQHLESGPCLSQRLRWIMHKASPRSLHLSADFRPQGGPRHSSCCLMLAETNFLHPGKVRRIQLHMGKCYVESNKRLMTSVDGPLLQGHAWRLGDAGALLPTTVAVPPSAQHPAPTM